MIQLFINRFFLKIITHALLIFLLCLNVKASLANGNYKDFSVDSSTQKVKMYLKDQNGFPLKNFIKLDNLINSQGEKLIFAMNAGIYMENLMPLGLFIENGKKVSKVNTRQNAYGNFYLQPNGVFVVTKTSMHIVSTAKYKSEFSENEIIYASQSGPMLVINGQINLSLLKANKSKTIRNGVCIDAKRNTIFSISSVPVSFIELANHFKEELNCQDALYFDGSISKMYWMGKNSLQNDVNLGPMIAVIKVNK